MYSHLARNRRSLTFFITFSLFVQGFGPLATFANDRKRKPIVVSFGQPNIWSLEQAHYLLSRMHMTNLDLQAKALTQDDLNPNIPHATRIQILKQLLEIGVQFDQGIGFQNQRIVETARFNDSRRRELITRRNSNQNSSLALAREISRLETERARMDLDASATDAEKKFKETEIAKKKEEQAAVKELITQDNAEIDTLAAEPASTPTAPNALPSPGQLPTSALEKLIEKNVDKLLEAARDPKLNATTMLDNTIQLQYEIVAKQLTLLRDEVGPGERLVFLELPQSIYTTPDSGDEKMAQSWWHVNGYTRTDPLLRLLLELFEVEEKWGDIQKVSAFKDPQRKEIIDRWTCDRARELQPVADKKTPSEADRQMEAQRRKQEEGDDAAAKNDPILRVFVGLKCERESARRAILGKLYREANNLFSRVEQNGARDTSELVEAIRKVIAAKKTSTPVAGGGAEKQIEVDAKRPGSETLLSNSAARKTEDDRRTTSKEIKELLLTILSEKDPLNPRTKEIQDKLAKFKSQVQEGSRIEKAIEFIRLDDEPNVAENIPADISRRTIRSVDIIPRQSSLNVNDIQNTVKATGILAGLKFLFGFAGQVNFQRQREQFEQFLHQELYASGFGKGSRDFGWTFGALPGTKRVAPGVRTTYAALVVPEDAESIVMSARGCYFPRKSYQPLDFSDTGHTDWDRENRFKSSNCGAEENFILTIPGGGDLSEFWVTNVDYQSGRNGGEFTTVSVRGNNFSSQMGVLVDGIPLFPSVGLAQPHLMPRATGANGATPSSIANDCTQATGICGRYERIDAAQIVFTFKMPANYQGTPTITLIGPGKSVDLNSIFVTVNREPNVNLRDSAPVMFGNGLSITDVQLLRDKPGSPTMTAVVTGSRFDARDSVYVNGIEVVAPQKQLKSPTLYVLTFPAVTDETLRVTVVQDKVAASKSVQNPGVLKITSSTVSDYQPATKDKPGVLVLKIEGLGFSRWTCRTVNVEGATCDRVSYLSPDKLILRLLNPQLPVVITLTHTQTGDSVSTAVEKFPESPPPKSKEESKPKEEPKPNPTEKPKPEEGV